MIQPSQLLLLSSVLELLGAILIALVVYGVHTRIVKEKSIDSEVLVAMRRERFYVYSGIGLLIISFCIEAYVRLGGYIIL